MLTKRCICGEPLTTREQLRRGYCTEICQRRNTPRHFSSAAWNGTPNLSLSVLRPGVQRRNGRDNRD